MGDKLPNGYFVDDLIWWGETLDREVWIAKGFIIEPRDLSEASVRDRNDVKAMLMTHLAMLGETYHAQWQWAVGSDYRDALSRYDEETDERIDEATPWCRFARKERHQRYDAAMAEGRLRRDRCMLFLSRKVDARPPAKSVRHRSRAQFLEQIIEQERVAFHNMLGTLRQMFDHTTITPMGDVEHFHAIRCFLNPDLPEGTPDEVAHELDTRLTIQENCKRSSQTKHPEASYRTKGMFENVVIVTRWPKSTWPGIFKALTKLDFLTYSISVNIHPKSVRKEIDKEERLIERLQGDFASEGKYSLLTSLRKKEKKVDLLAQGYTLPFEVLYLVRVWDESAEGVAAKTRAVENAVMSMAGAQCYSVTAFTPAKHLSWQVWPGWLGGKYNHRDIYAEHEYLVDLLPFSATFVGHLKEAHAIWDGDNKNLVGLRLFANGTPQHAVVFGMTRSGKSAWMCDLLSQVSQYLSYLLIVEEGLSYGIFAATEGSDPIIIHPDGEVTINYFDTHGLPLTSLQLSTATALLHQMAGFSATEEDNRARSGILSEYVVQTYEDFAEKWLKQDEGRAWHAMTMGNAVERWRRERMPINSTYADAFCALRDFADRREDEARSFIHALDEGDIVRWSKTGDGERIIRNFLFSSFEPEEFPRHEMLVEMMETAIMRHHDKDVVNRLVSSLHQWRAGGDYGKLFDGVTNVSLTNKVSLFELAYAPPQMKAAAGFLIANYGRQNMMTLPRHLWKMTIFEELSRFMNVPGGEQIVSENYAQMAKFSCVIWSIVQQYNQFKSSSIRPVVIDNSAIKILMRQQDQGDLDDIGNDIGLTEATKSTIMSYPIPAQMSDGERYSSATYFVKDPLHPVCGTIRNICCPEMLYCSSSTGEDFEKRSRELKQYSSVHEGIFAETDKRSAEAARRKEDEERKRLQRRRVSIAT